MPPEIRRLVVLACFFRAIRGCFSLRSLGTRSGSDPRKPVDFEVIPRMDPAKKPARSPLRADETKTVRLAARGRLGPPWAALDADAAFTNGRGMRSEL